MIKLEELSIDEISQGAVISVDRPLIGHQSVDIAEITAPNAAKSVADTSFDSIGFSYFSQILSIGLPLWVADLVSIVTGTGIGLAVAIFCGLTVSHPIAFIGFLAAVYSVSFYSAGLYPGLGLHPARELRTTFRSTVFTAISIGLGLGLLTNWGSPYVLATAIGGMLQLAAMPLLRGGAKSWMLKRGIGIPVAFLGSKDCVERTYRDMKRFGNPMLRAIGRFSDADSDHEYNFESNEALTQPNLSMPLLGSGTEAIAVGRSKGIHQLIVVGDEASSFLDRNPEIVAGFPEVIVSRSSRSQTCSGSSVVNYGLASGIRIEESRLLPSARFVKRAVDIAVSSVALALLAPLFLAIAAMVRLSSPGPIFFGHSRIGLGGRSFKAWKFRSMVPDANDVLENYLSKHPELRAEWERDHKLKDDPRITWIGRAIRKTSIDELPQLWNVLVGDMSLVGPRPIVTSEIEKYGATFREYLKATPGITGLWQVSGRNNTTYEERLAYDEFYVRHWSPWMDLYILIRTVRTVLFCEGAY